MATRFALGWKSFSSRFVRKEYLAVRHFDLVLPAYAVVGEGLYLVHKLLLISLQPHDSFRDVQRHDLRNLAVDECATLPTIVYIHDADRISTVLLGNFLLVFLLHSLDSLSFVMRNNKKYYTNMTMIF